MQLKKLYIYCLFLSMAVSEEEIIRCRLLFDGEGTGDDRRIQTLLKTIVKWCHTDTNYDESNLTYQKIIALLNQCEYSMVKNHLVYEMNNVERKNYEVGHANVPIPGAEALTYLPTTTTL